MITPEMLAKSGTEDAEQSALFCWLALAATHGVNVANAASTGMGVEAAKTSYGNRTPVPEMRLAFAIPNGGKRDKRTAVTLKATGVKAGVPDIMVPVARGDFHGLFIELKRQGTTKIGKRGAQIIDRAAGTPSERQEGWIADLGRQGYAVRVCEGWQSAAGEIAAYLAAE